MLAGSRATLKKATAKCLLGDGVAAVKVETVGGLVWRSRAAFNPVFVKAAFCVAWVLNYRGRSYVILLYWLVHVRNPLRLPLKLSASLFVGITGFIVFMKMAFNFSISHEFNLGVMMCGVKFVAN